MWHVNSNSVTIQFQNFDSVNAIDVDTIRIRCTSGECEFNLHSNQIKCEKALVQKGLKVLHLLKAYILRTNGFSRNIPIHSIHSKLSSHNKMLIRFMGNSTYSLLNIINFKEFIRHFIRTKGTLHNYYV